MERKNVSIFDSRIASIFEDANHNEKVLVTEDWRRHSPEIREDIAYGRNAKIKCGDEEDNSSMPLSDEELEFSEIWKETREKIRQRYLKSRSSSAPYDDSFGGRTSHIQNHDIFPVVKGIDENFIRDGVNEELEPTLNRMDAKTKDPLKFTKLCPHKVCPTNQCYWSTQTKSCSYSFGITSIQEESGKRMFYNESENSDAIKDDKCHAMEEVKKLMDIRGNNVAEKKISSGFTTDTQERFGVDRRHIIEPLHPYQKIKKMHSHVGLNAMRYLEQNVAERDLTKEISKTNRSNASHDRRSEEIKNTLYIDDKKNRLSHQRETLPSFCWLKDNSKSGSHSSAHDLANTYKKAKEESDTSDVEEFQILKKYKPHKWDEGENADHGILCISSKQDSEHTLLRKDTSYEEEPVKLNNPKFCSDNEQSNILWDKDDYDVNRGWWKNVKRVNLPDLPYGTTNKNFEIAVKQVFWNMNKINTQRKRNYPAENSMQIDAGGRENTLSSGDANFNTMKILKTDESREIQEVKEDEKKVLQEAIENSCEDSISVIDEKNTKSCVSSNRGEVHKEERVTLSKNYLELIEIEQSNGMQLHGRDEKEALKCTFENVTPPKEKMEMQLHGRDEKEALKCTFENVTPPKEKMEMQLHGRDEKEALKCTFEYVTPPKEKMEIQLHERDEKEALKCTYENVTSPNEKMEEKVDCEDEIARKTLKQDQIKMQNFQERKENETPKINFSLIDLKDKVMETPKEEIDNEERALEKKSRNAEDKEKETRRGKISLTAEEKAMLAMEISSLVDEMITEKEKELMLGNAIEVIDNKANADMIDNNQKENYITKKTVEKSFGNQDTEMAFLKTERKMMAEMSRKNMIGREGKVKEHGDELLKANSRNLYSLNDTKFCLREQGVEDTENFQEEKVMSLEVERIEREIEKSDINKNEWKADSDKTKEKAPEIYGLELQEIIKNDKIKIAVEEREEQNNDSMFKGSKGLNDEKVGEFHKEKDSHDGKIKYGVKDIKELIARLKREVRENEVLTNEKHEEETVYKYGISSDENGENHDKNEMPECLVFDKKTDEEINGNGEGAGNSLKTCHSMNEIECNLRKDVIILDKNLILSGKMKGACKNRFERAINLDVKELKESIDDFESMEDENQSERSQKQNELEENMSNYTLKEENGKFICESNSILLKEDFIGGFRKSDGIELFKESKTGSAKTSNLSSVLYENEFSKTLCNESTVDEDILFKFSSGKTQKDEMTSEKNELVTLEENRIIEDEMTSSNADKGNGLFIHDLALAIQFESKHLDYTCLSVDETIDDIATSNLSEFNLGKDSEMINSEMQFQFNVDCHKTNVPNTVISSKTNIEVNGRFGVNFHVHGMENTVFGLDDERKMNVYANHKKGIDDLETTEFVKELALFGVSVQNKKVLENNENKMNFLKFLEVFGKCGLLKMNEVGITSINFNLINIRQLDRSKILTEKVFHTLSIEKNKLSSTYEKESREMCCIDDGVVEMNNKSISVHYAKLEDIIVHDKEMYDDNTNKWNASGVTDIFEFNEPNEALVSNCGLSHSIELIAQETNNYENNEELLSIEDRCDTHAIKELTIHSQLNANKNIAECRERSINCENQIEAVSGFDRIVPAWEEEPFEISISENNIFHFDFDGSWEEPFKMTMPALNEYENYAPPQNYTNTKKQKEKKLETVSKSIKCMAMLGSMTYLEEGNLIENQICNFGDGYLPKQKPLESPKCIVDENKFNDMSMDVENKYPIPETMFSSMENASFESSSVTKDIQSSTINWVPEGSFKNKKDCSDDLIDSFSLDEYLSTIIDKHCESEQMKDHLLFNSTSDSKPLLNNMECQTELGGLMKTFHTQKCLETLLLSGNELEFCQYGERKRNLHALNIETTSNKRFKKKHDLCVDYFDNIFINNIADGKNDSLLRVESSAFDTNLQKSAVTAVCKNRDTIGETVANKVLQYEEQEWADELDDQPMEDENFDQKVPDVTNQDNLQETDEESSQIWDGTIVNEAPIAKMKELPSISNTPRSSTVLRLGLSKRAKLPRLHHIQ